MFEPPCGREVVTSVASQLAADETFNQPLTRFNDADSLAAHESALKARFIDQVQAWSLAGFLAERAAARSNAVHIDMQGTQNATDEFGN
jgi:hypothetical protein